MPQRQFLITSVVLLAVLVSCRNGDIEEKTEPTEPVSVTIPAAETSSPTAIHIPTLTDTPVTIPPTMLAIQSREPAATSTAEHLCTELDCVNNLFVRLEGAIQDSFIAQMVDKNGEQLIVQCFDGPSYNQYAVFDSYQLESAPPDIIEPFSEAAQLCSDSGSGHIGIWRHDDGAPQLVTVACGGWSEPEINKLLLESSCSIENEGGLVIGVYPTQRLPQQVTVTVYWNELTLTRTFKLNYESNLPNGPACEPECFDASLKIALPEPAE